MKILIIKHCWLELIKWISYRIIKWLILTIIQKFKKINSFLSLNNNCNVQLVWKIFDNHSLLQLQNPIHWIQARAPASHGQLIQSVSQLQLDNSTSHDPSLRGIGQSEASDFIRLSRSVECDDNNTRRAHMHTNTIRDLESQGNLIIYDYTV